MSKRDPFRKGVVVFITSPKLFFEDSESPFALRSKLEEE